MEQRQWDDIADAKGSELNDCCVLLFQCSVELDAGGATPPASLRDEKVCGELPLLDILQYEECDTALDNSESKVKSRYLNTFGVASWEKDD